MVVDLACRSKSKPVDGCQLHHVDSWLALYTVYQAFLVVNKKWLIGNFVHMFILVANRQRQNIPGHQPCGNIKGSLVLLLMM